MTDAAVVRLADVWVTGLAQYAHPEHPPETLHVLAAGSPTALGWDCDGRGIVYALVDPRQPRRIRYIGQSRRCVTRYYAHIANGAAESRGPKSIAYEWVASLLAARRMPVMVLIEVPRYTHVLGMRERFFLHYYQERGVKLLNSVPPKAKPWKRRSRGAA